MENTFRQLNALLRTAEQREKLKQKLEQNEAVDGRHNSFYLDGPKVMNTLPSGEKVELLMTKADVDAKLRTEYDKPEHAGNWVTNFYLFMKYRFLGITRAVVETFLKGDTNYVLAQPMKKWVNRSVVASVKAPDSLWSIDLIEMSEQFHESNTVDAGGDSTFTRRGRRTQSKVYRYIFSCMDVFSRKIWLRAMVSKETTNRTVEALWSIIQSNDLDTPKAILCDRGLEFKGEFENYCKQNDITTGVHTQCEPGREKQQGRARRVAEAHGAQCELEMVGFAASG
jgi:hypothetical protein